MESIPPNVLTALSYALKIAKLLKDAHGWFLGEGELSAKDLRIALNDAVNEITVAIDTGLEELQSDLAQNKVETLIRICHLYTIDDLPWRLQAADSAASDAYDACNNSIDLIDKGGIRGKGLLGHHLFMISASIYFFILHKWAKIHKKNGENDKANGIIAFLRDMILESNNIAIRMEQEWIDWTNRRFGQLKSTNLKEHWVTEPESWFLRHLEVSCEWTYTFNGERIKIHERSWPHSGQSESFNSRQYKEANAIALKLYEEKLQKQRKKVTEMFIEKSREIRVKWNELLMYLSPGEGKSVEHIIQLGHDLEIIRGHQERLNKIYISILEDEIEEAKRGNKPGRQ